MNSTEDSLAGEQSRRELLARMGTGLVAITVDTAFGQLTPARARARGAPLRNLDPAEGRTLEALGEVLLPGAVPRDVLLGPRRAAAELEPRGIAWAELVQPQRDLLRRLLAHFVDDQLSRENPMLLLKYLDFTAAYTDFYKLGLAGLERVSQAKFRTSFPDLEPEQKMEIVREMSQKDPAAWTGPPAPLFFFVIRNDAVDVLYGTPQGFQKLGIPYMAHILPAQKW